MRDDELLVAWGWSRWFERELEASSEADNGIPARVTSQHRGAYRLIAAVGELDGVAPGRMLYRATGRRALPAVGDWVVARPQLDGPAAIVEILRRRTEFVRRKAGTETQEQVVAANVDVVFLMSSLNLELNLRRLERYLVATRDSGADAVVVLTKADLATDEASAVAAVRAGTGVPVHTISSVTGDGIELLHAYLEPGKTIALLGSSGVGKSTLVNRLAGRELLPTQEIRDADDRGRHTTTHREIYRLPDGALLLDTPGMRELGLWGADEGLQETFEDVEELMSRCRFRDCGHDTEPDCAVRAALADGTLAAHRWASFRKLQSELAYDRRRTDRSAALAERDRWKQIHKDMRKAPKKGG